MNESGKVVTIFVVITAILLVSLTAISFFFFQQEYQKRKEFEDRLGEANAKALQLQAQTEEAQKQKFLLEEKNKELDERVNSLLDELELEQGLKEEMKREQLALNEKLDKEVKAKEKLKEELNKKFDEAQTRINELEAKLRVEIEAAQVLKERNRLLENENIQMAEGLGLTGYVPAAGSVVEPPTEGASAPATEQNLDEIVVTTGDGAADAGESSVKVPDGRVISVDEETEFVIIDLGKKHGMTLGRMLSVYRGDQYLGDIKVTRVQPEMSAADIILPLTGKILRKNDQVIVK
jgi:hypothetical protein